MERPITLYMDRAPGTIHNHIFNLSNLIAGYSVTGILKDEAGSPSVLKSFIIIKFL